MISPVPRFLRRVSNFQQYLQSLPLPHIIPPLHLRIYFIPSQINLILQKQSQIPFKHLSHFLHRIIYIFESIERTQELRSCIYFFITIPFSAFILSRAFTIAAFTFVLSNSFNLPELNFFDRPLPYDFYEDFTFPLETSLEPNWLGLLSLWFLLTCLFFSTFSPFSGLPLLW